MNIRKTLILASTIALTTFTLPPTPANAGAAREFLSSFGPFEEPAGIAVNLETGNVYVTDGKTKTVDISGPTGGPPTNGAPTQITGLNAEIGTKPWGIAVDNSCYEHEPRLTGTACEEYDPAYGDVYMASENNGPGVQKFKLNVKKEYELTGEISSPGGTEGVAVDSRGNLYTASYFPDGKSIPAPGGTPEPEYKPVEFKKIVEKAINGGVEEVKEHLEEIIIPQHIAAELGYVAVDGLGDVYVGSWQEAPPRSHGVAKLKVDTSGNLLSEEVLTAFQEGVFRPLAVDSSTNNVLVGDESQVLEYDAAGALQLSFGSSEPQGGLLGKGFAGVKGIAVNGPAERVYVVNPAHSDVDVFGPVVGPPVVDAQQPAASGVGRTSALLAGTVNPESGQASYYFQYVPEAEYEPDGTDPYRQGGRTAIASLAGGHVPETIERVTLTGLRPGTTYHYRLVAINASATVYGPDETFTTIPATPPIVVTGSAGEVGTTSATLSGVVDPRGLSTSYVFEVGSDTGYDGAKLFGNAGSSTGEVPVTVSLAYLTPGATYHYRLVATSFDGTSYGQDGMFTTATVPYSIVQPASTPLIASPTGGFPSIAGAIRPRANPAKISGSRVKLKRALRACHRIRARKSRSSCEARARKHYGEARQSRAAANTTHHPRSN